MLLEFLKLIYNGAVYRLFPTLSWKQFKGCVRYIFASLFFKLKGEHLENKEKCFLFHFKNSFRSRENQVLEF